MMKRAAARIGVAQMCSSMDKQDNFRICEHLVQQAKAQGAELVCFPEAFEYMGRPGTTDSIDNAEYLDGPTMGLYKKLAQNEKVWLSLGGFHEKLQDDCKRIANTHCIVNSEGEIVHSYRKIHLFDVDYDGGYKESNSTIPGTEIGFLPETPFGNIGITICYDVRFPELYSILRDKGCNLILVPSAFMPTTGAAHWHVLLRARAIETQSYVVASAQTGRHNDTGNAVERIRESFGHSLVVDPFGKVLHDLEGRTPHVAVFEMDFDMIEDIRKKMPVQQHRHASQETLSKSK